MINSKSPRYLSYSSQQETDMLDHDWIKGKGPAYLKDFDDETIYLQMPIVRLVNCLIGLAADNMPLTPKGNPKRSVIPVLYLEGPKDHWVENGLSKLYNLESIPTLERLWDLFHLIGIFRKYKNTLRLTQKGKELKGHPKAIAHYLLATLQTFADNALIDEYKFQAFNNSIELMAVMLDDYGDVLRPCSFYAEKYIKIEPAMQFYADSLSEQGIRDLVSCFDFRILDSFLYWFGWIEYHPSHFNKETGKYDESFVKRTALFEQLIGITPPQPEREIPFVLYRSNNPYLS